MASHMLTISRMRSWLTSVTGMNSVVPGMLVTQRLCANKPGSDR